MFDAEATPRRFTTMQRIYLSSLNNPRELNFDKLQAVLGQTPSLVRWMGRNRNTTKIMTRAKTKLFFFPMGDFWIEVDG